MLLLALVVSGTVQASAVAELPLRLSSLVEGCSLVQRATGLMQRMPVAVWLRCKSEEFMVVDPLNLVGHVRIEEEKQALEFVRFFSTDATRGLQGRNGGMEVLPVSPVSQGGFNVVSSELMRKHHIEGPQVRRDTSAPPLENQWSFGGSNFLVERSLMFPDGTIQRCTESLNQNGYYDVVRCDRQIAEASKIGIIYLPVD